MTTETSVTPGMRHACFAGLVLLASAVCYRALLTVAGESLTVDAYAPFAFIPPVSLALIYTERREIFSINRFWRVAVVGYVLLFTALIWAGSLSLSVRLFSAACIAAFGTCYGRAASKRAAFPLALLLGMAPMPQLWLDRSIDFLQRGSAIATGWLFSIANVPFSRHGLIFSLPRLDIEIARECSGIRSSLILLICGLVIAHLFLKAGWTKGLLAAAIIPVTIAKNGLRIFTLAMLGMYVDPSFLTGRLHRDGGGVFFALAFVALLGLIKVLRKVERIRVPANSAVIVANPVA
ncbi:MAG TPA: exosortase/archaeosortase family protein [Terriglobales bacterium]|jgi:exosortase|nr:exosortase/archaeosortase family protein [Terriglobales bacterium]